MAWGQTPDYSGNYYIGSRGYTTPIPSPNTNYYLCPTEGWAFYVDQNEVTGNDNGQPFLTTYQCKNGSYDASKAVWTLVKHPTEADCYYIIQTSTGKYVVSNGTLTGAGSTRARVHLENVADDAALTALGDKALFEVTIDDSHYDIKPHSTYGRDGNYTYLVVNNGNDNQLVGNNSKTNGPTGFKNCGGIIGLYTHPDNGNAYFYLEDYITRPTIAYNSSGLVEITAAQTSGTIEIKYTTDGSTPSSSNGTNYTGPFDPDDNVTTIKAVAIVDNEASNVATFVPIVLLGENHKRLIQNQNNAWTTGDHQGNHFYMIPGDEDRVNTTSMLRPTMEWYFKYAGEEDNFIYYYIINNVSGLYLCYDTDIYTRAYNESDDNKYKFRLQQYPTTETATDYNIVPYEQTSGNMYLHKSNNNNNAANISLNSSYSSANSRWKFVLKDALDTTAPFSQDKIYKIRCNGEEYYVTTPASAGSNATASKETGVDDKSWIFETAKTATNDDWRTYYYIRNALTGEYLYYTNSNPSGNNAAFATSSTITAGSEDRYMFTWARSVDNDYYFLVPFMVRDETLNNITSMNRNNSELRVQKVRGTGTSAWTFVEIAPQYPKPSIHYDNVTGKVSFSSLFSGATYYYTTDGTTTPAEEDTYKYNAPFTISEETTIKVFATKSGYTESDVVTQTIYKVAAPTTEITSTGSIRIVSSTPGVAIYYTTDGSTPTTSSTRYTSPLTDITGKVIRAIAVKDGWITSDIGGSSGAITLQCGMPVIKRGSNNTFTITCDYPTEGVTIYYTTDETNPTTANNVYSGPVSFLYKRKLLCWKLYAETEYHPQRLYWSV